MQLTYNAIVETQNGMTVHKEKKSKRDTLVSIAIIAEHKIDSFLEVIVKQCEKISETYLFTEILIINNSSNFSAKEMIDRLSVSGAQCRVIQFDRKLNFDQLASHAYKESIGDIVLVASVEELQTVPIEVLVEKIYQGQNLVRTKRIKAKFLERLISKIIGILTGLDIDTRFMRTMAMNRSLLSELLPQEDLISFFRFYSRHFEPNQETIKINTPILRKGWKTLTERAWTLAQLLSMSAQRLLSIMVCFSSLLTFLSFIWLNYVIFIYFFKTDVSEGWVSLSFVMGSGFLIQTLTSTVLCLGLSRLLDKQTRHSNSRITSDLSSSDFFKDFNQVNVQSLKE